MKVFSESLDQFGVPLFEMRTKNIKVDGKEVEAVLMAGGPGYKIYSAGDAVVVQANKKTMVFRDGDPKQKTVLMFVNLKYQSLDQRDAITSDFMNLISGS